MDIVEAIRSRMSVRNYKPIPVPKKILEEVLGIATRAPSAMNTQPWEIAVISGEVLENIKQGNIEMINSGIEPSPEVAVERYEGSYRQRQVDLAIEIFNLMGIAREDKEKRAEWMQLGCRFFDAPAAIILYIDRAIDDFKLPRLDFGSLAQTICLAALNYGLGTCIEDQGILYPDVVRRYTNIPESKRLIICIAIGYPDWDFPANKLQSTREPLENIVAWHGFD